jgi:hypothetical protein
VAKLHSVELNLAPAQYLAGWNPQAGKLFLPALSDARGGDEVAARVGILGQGIRATVFGAVALVRRFGRPSLPTGVELVLDAMSLPAARFLALAARGEPIEFRERAPRYVVTRPLRVRRDRGEEQPATTLNVSQGGCALAWAGPFPDVGEVLAVKLGDGLLAPTARAVVCWTAPGPPQQRSVGLRLVGEGRAARAWRAMAEEAARSEAPVA